jgi:hypothetical protein
MRKHILRLGGLLLVAGSLLGIVPARNADAKTSCACFTLCVVGKHCCPIVVGGQCTNECIPNGEACPLQ